MKAALKAWVENLLLRSGAERLSRRNRRGDTLVLAYHSIVPDGELTTGDLSLHLSHGDFVRQLDVLGQSHDVVPITRILDSSAASSRPRVVITFDDAYAGALTVGVDELVKRGMPATIFVAPALLGSVPWWDTLAKSTGGTVPESLRSHALDALSGKTDLVLSLARPQSVGSRSGLTPPRIGTESELSKAASKPGMSIGTHTWSHPNLCKLDESELSAELRLPLEWLRSRFASVVPWLSYPYGLHNKRVQNAAAKAGYVAAFRIDGGWIPTRSSLPCYTLPRLNIPSGISLDGFRLRIAGL